MSEGKNTRLFDTPPAYSAIVASVVAAIWAAIHISSLPQSDSLGIGTVLKPLAYLVLCCFFFFLVWPPLLGIVLGIRTLSQAKPSVARVGNWTVFILSLLPFLLCLRVFLTSEIMARYHSLHK